MAASKQQSASAVSQRSVQRMREAIDGALSSRIDSEVREYSINADPGPSFPRAVPTIPGLQSIALGPSAGNASAESAPVEKPQSEWHVITSEGAAAVGEHHELLQRVATEEETLPEVVLVHGNPDEDSEGESLRIRLCNQDGEPTSLEDLELEEVPDVVPFVGHLDPLTRLVEAWPELDTSTQDAILMLVNAAAG